MLVRRRDNPFMLVVGMTGAKLGDRLAQVGCADGGQLAAIAAKVGLSGRAVAIVPDEATAARARKSASRAGVLVEVEVSPPTRLPVEDGSFDLIVVDDTGGQLATMDADDRAATIREALRGLRPGGRLMVIGAARRGGLAGLFSRAPAEPRFDPVPLLEAGGFNTVRTLAERAGLVFIEGLKARV